MARVTVKRGRLVNYAVQIDGRDADEYTGLWNHCKPWSPFGVTGYAYFSTLWGAMCCVRRVEKFLKDNPNHKLLKDSDGIVYLKDI